MRTRPPRELGGAARLLAVITFVASLAAPVVGETATITKTRWGKTDRDETRVVFELDHSVAWKVNSDPSGTAFEIRLTGATPAPGVAGLKITDARVDVVTIRQDAQGTVALISSSGKPLRAKSFELANPPRVVVDLGLLPADAPVPPASPPTTAPPTAVPPTATKTQAAPPSEPPPAAAPPPGTPKSDFDDLVTWLHSLDGKVETLSSSRTERDRAKNSRSLAYFLAERGISREAERALAASLASREHERSTARDDSLFLAELRLEIGDTEGAVAVAEALIGKIRSAPEIVRLATVLSDCHRPAAAQQLLEPKISDLRGDDHLAGLLLLARCHWDQRNPEKALPLLETLTKPEEATKGTYYPALILYADCLWAAGRTGEARLRYERAARRELPDEEASWVMLQLGNVARREGRLEDAKQHYQTTMDRWPHTFYAAQAVWFLRIVDDVDHARAEVGSSRG
jgi:hypothetical protein